MELIAYETEAGRVPFNEWLESLDRVARARVGVAIKRLESGNLSSTKSVGSGVFEFRIDFGPGYRIYFGQDGQEIVLLLTGGDKPRQQRDIDAAIILWNQYKLGKRGT
jgi:putative addiction module killer protein